MGSDTDARFEVYDKTRNEVPSSVDEAIDTDGDVLDGVDPDEVVTGYDTLCDLLDADPIERTVDVSDVEWREEDQTTVEVSRYFWREVDSETAPEHTICSECDITIRSRSDERVSKARNAHHAGTGH